MSLIFCNSDAGTLFRREPLQLRLGCQSDWAGILPLVYDIANSNSYELKLGIGRGNYKKKLNFDTLCREENVNEQHSENNHEEMRFPDTHYKYQSILLNDNELYLQSANFQH